MTSRLFKIIVLLAVSSLVAGCKVAVIVPSGGDVKSLSGTRNCNAGQLCEFNVTDTAFSDSFTAVAKPGYQFVRWQKGTDFQCGDLKSPTCVVTLSGNAVLDAALVNLFERQYIMPIFKDVGFDSDGDGIRNELDEDDDNDGILDVDDVCTLNPDPECVFDFVIANGLEWAQPDHFLGHTRDEINAVCPAGVCNGTLNGLNLYGWKLASQEQLDELFVQYGAGAALPANERCLLIAQNFVANGWRITEFGGGPFQDSIFGRLPGDSIGYIDLDPTHCYYGYVTDGNVAQIIPNNYIGVFLVRTM